MVGDRSTKCRMLVVEDDAVSCHAMSALLTRWGHDVRSCTTTVGALDEIARRRPQCLLLDLMLPDHSGLEVLRTIRRQELPIRVAIITAANDPQLLRDVRDLKPDAILRKPVDLAELKGWLLRVEEETRRS